MKVLLITGCSDCLMWYRDKVGQKVVFSREDKDYYWSKEPAGYTNIVHKKDAVIQESEEPNGTV
jgi:hypothetical protein